ncbi:hypothetical protein [uncultured Maritimibacter sp.]|jgi:hypothetical protein|uniref:hypothetical protein n=1 Tax=uncultured Maritimibacter sp. TaxID=991866 RepID=UPI0026257E25|nr:hypothetical protein [uncultured Maritimibacter sp.]
MLRPTAYIAMIALILWSAFQPALASPVSVCPQTASESLDACFQPGAPMPAQADGAKTCGTCILPAEAVLPSVGSQEIVLVAESPARADYGRTVLPDRRPPRA